MSITGLKRAVRKNVGHLSGLENNINTIWMNWLTFRLLVPTPPPSPPEVSHCAGADRFPGPPHWQEIRGPAQHDWISPATDQGKVRKLIRNEQSKRIWLMNFFDRITSASVLKHQTYTYSMNFVRNRKKIAGNILIFTWSNDSKL